MATAMEVCKPDHFSELVLSPFFCLLSKLDFLNFCLLSLTLSLKPLSFKDVAAYLPRVGPSSPPCASLKWPFPLLSSILISPEAVETSQFACPEIFLFNLKTTLRFFLSLSLNYFISEPNPHPQRPQFILYHWHTKTPMRRRGKKIRSSRPSSTT